MEETQDDRYTKIRFLGHCGGFVVAVFFFLVVVLQQLTFFIPAFDFMYLCVRVYVFLY